MAAVTAIVRKPVLGVGAVYIGANVALAWWMTQIARTLRLPLLSAALAIALVLLNPFVLSATGMETPLVAALLVGLLCYTVQDRPVRFGILAGLAVLTRVDLVIFVAVLGMSTPSMRRRLPKAALSAVLVSGPWFVWSWFRLGSAIPDTFVIKTLQHSFGKWSFGNGPFGYLERNAAATWLSFLPALLGAMALAVWGAARLWVGRVGTELPPTTRGRWRRLDPVAALGAGGIAYYLAYSLLGVPNYQWYYCPVMVALSGSVTLLLPDAIGAARSRVRLSMLVLAAAVLVFVVAAQAVMVLAHDPPWREPVIFGNWAAPSDYIRVGEILQKRIGDGTAASPGEIGTLAFACDCVIVDAFSDRGWVVPLVKERIARAGPLARFLLKLNYFNLSRGVRPRPVDYDLSWKLGPASGPDSWGVRSSAHGVGHIQLERRINPPVITAPLRSIVSGTTSLFTSADDRGVARVEYRVFGKPFYFDFPIGTATRVGCCRWVLRWDTRSVPNGDYRVVSLAFTAAGKPARSAPRSITVAN
jgi:hypothetical protein